MALTLSEVASTVIGNKRLKIVDITFDSSYPTGGEAIAAASLGMVKIDHIMCGSGDGIVVEYDRANKKIKAFWVDTSTDGAVMAEVPNTTDLSAVNTVAWVLGF